MQYPRSITSPPGLFLLGLFLPGFVLACTSVFGQAGPPAIEEVVIWGQQQRSTATAAHPASLLTPRDVASINLATTEDLVKFEPGLVIRRRFIGDANGTLGMRGSNMFQTSHSMVFADGVPLHYLLQTRWNGAPRWTLVSASEIAQVEVLYGPFSAEYSGNAMGGVVLIESAIPQRREFHFDSSVFSQRFDAYGFNDTLHGYKSFMSFGDKLGDTSVFLSWNHLDNSSQPQTFYYGQTADAGSAVPVTGGLAGNDERSVSRLWFGDTGVIGNITDNYKIKLGQSIGAWDLLLNLAYEDRGIQADSPHSYLRDSDGQTVWSGNVIQQDKSIAVPAARMGVNTMQRDSLSTSLRIHGNLTDQVALELNANRFAVLRDETRFSLANPADPLFTPRGEVQDFGATGWRSLEAKLQIDDMAGIAGLNLRLGARTEQYEMNLDVFASADYRAASFLHFTDRSGGTTALEALFAQIDWMLAARWTLGLGLRHEAFASSGGYFAQDDPATPRLDLAAVPAASSRKYSPKFSLAWQAADAWQLAYALGQAYRFPIVEELFSQYSAWNSVNIASPALEPEDGLHHNLSITRQLPASTLRMNLFHERINNVIEAQSQNLPGGLTINTFIPLDEIRTRGVELIANLDGLLADNLDIRFNATWTDSEIVRNGADPSIEGNTYPRMPDWRSNLLATWHVNAAWDLGLSLQYASDSFGRNDNTDLETGVYNAQDAFTLLGFKSTWRLGNGLALGIGVDNLTDTLAFVAHPWPGRTFYMNLAYDL